MYKRKDLMVNNERCHYRVQYREVITRVDQWGQSQLILGIYAYRP